MCVFLNVDVRKIRGRMGLSQVDMPGRAGYDGAHSTESDVIYVEQHNLCTEANAKKGLGVEKRARDAQDKY